MNMAFNEMEIIQEKQESINRLEQMLYNAIISWYDDSLTEYHGLDDEEFINRVCGLTGLSESEYEDLVSGNTEECSWQQQNKRYILTERKGK